MRSSPPRQRSVILMKNYSQVEIYDLVKKFQTKFKAYSKDELIKERLKYRSSQQIEILILNEMIQTKVINHSAEYYSKKLREFNPNSNMYKVYRALKAEASHADYHQLLHDNQQKLNKMQEQRESFMTLRSNLYLNIAEASEESAEILKSTGEVTEKMETAHHAGHVVETSSQVLHMTGIIGMVVANILGLLINANRCIRQRRRPDDFEKAKMTYSGIILVLGVLVVAGVGGPYGIAVLAASAIFLSFTKTVAVFIRDAYRLRSTRIAVEKGLKENQEISLEISDLLNKASVDQGRLEKLKENLLKNQNTLRSNSLKLTVLEHRSNSKLDKFRKTGGLLASILCVVGAVMSLTPLAPIGFMLIGLGATLGLSVEIGFQLGKYLHKRRNQHLQELNPGPSFLNPGPMPDIPHEQDSEEKICEQLGASLSETKRPLKQSSAMIKPIENESSLDEDEKKDKDTDDNHPHLN